MLSQQSIAVNLFNMFGTDADEAGFYAERRLWCAVVISTVEEYVEWLNRINNSWNVHQRPVDRSFKFSLHHIRRQCKTQWFQIICEMADFSADRVFRKFNELDKEYCIEQIPFQDEPERFMSQWAIRKINKQKIAN